MELNQWSLSVFVSTLNGSTDSQLNRKLWTQMSSTSMSVAYVITLWLRQIGFWYQSHRRYNRNRLLDDTKTYPTLIKCITVLALMIENSFFVVFSLFSCIVLLLPFTVNKDRLVDRVWKISHGSIRLRAVHDSFSINTNTFRNICWACNAWAPRCNLS